MYKKLEKCLKSIREKTDFKPEKAVILGSGLGDYAEKIKIEKIVKYTDIEDFPVSTVQGHKGQFVFGYVEDAMRKLASEHPSEKVGAEIRKLYSWNGEDKLINN